MKAKVKRTGEGWQVLLPSITGFNDGEEADVLTLREGVFLVSRAGMLEQMQKEHGAQGVIPARAQAPSSNSVMLKEAEVSLVHKLMDIRFQERSVPSTNKKLKANELALLEGLMERGIVSIFKNAKYKEGVYNIPRDVFRAVASPGEKQEGPARGQVLARKEIFEGLAPVVSGVKESPARQTPVAPASPAPAPMYSRASLPQSEDGKIAVNSPAHLQKYGYMVLDNENEARQVMEGVQSVQKSDPVKGVRGFDRKYYVLRKSFLSQHQAPVLAILDGWDANSETVAKDLNITPTAAQVPMGNS